MVKDNVNPGFGTEFIFYRRFPNEPITVQVWNYNLIKDSYMGKALFPCPVTNDRKVYTADLQGRWREKGMAKPGKVTIEATSVNDLFFLWRKLGFFMWRKLVFFMKARSTCDASSFLFVT